MLLNITFQRLYWQLVLQYCQNKRLALNSSGISWCFHPSIFKVQIPIPHPQLLDNHKIIIKIVGITNNYLFFHKVCTEIECISDSLIARISWIQTPRTHSPNLPSKKKKIFEFLSKHLITWNILKYLCFCGLITCKEY